MPVGWPLHLDGAVKQRYVHRTTTLQELDDLLSAYDMKRDLVELNYTAQWAHRAVWNQWCIEKAGLQSGPAVGRSHYRHNPKVTSSQEVTSDDIQRVAAIAASKPTAQLPQSDFSVPLEPLRLFGPHLKQDHTFKEQQRSMNQAGKTEIIKKDGGEMLVAIALDKPLADVKELEDPTAEIMQILPDVRPLEAPFKRPFKPSEGEGTVTPAEVHRREDG